MSEVKPIKCQKCGRPVGYITTQVKTLLGTQQQPVKNVTVLCLNCRPKRYTVH